MEQAGHKKKRSITGRTPYLLLIPAFALLVVFIISPSAYSIYLSFTRFNINIPGQNTPTFFGLGQYTFGFFKDIYLSQTVAVSLEWAAISVSSIYLFGLLIALVLNQRNLRGRTFFRVAITLSFAVPITGAWPIWDRILDPTAGLVNQVLNRLGLEDPSHPIQWVNSYPIPTVAMVAVWSGFAFTAITILATLQSVPKEQYDAAKVDAAGRLSVFRYIEWPNLMPLNVVIWLFLLISALNTFNVIFVLTGGGPGFATTTLFLYAYKNFGGSYMSGGMGSGDYGYTAMLSTLLFVAEIIVGVFYIRYLMVRRR